MVANPRIELPVKQIEAFCRKFGVQEFSLFGSVLRDDFGPDSDVDVMLKFLPGRGFTFENTPDIQDELKAEVCTYRNRDFLLDIKLRKV